MPPDPPSRHARLHVRERAFARYYHLLPPYFPPPQLKILYETLTCICSRGFFSLDNDEQSTENPYLPIIVSGPATDGGAVSPLERTRYVCAVMNSDVLQFLLSGLTHIQQHQKSDGTNQASTFVLPYTCGR